MSIFELLTSEQIEAYDSDPRSIEWRKQQDRSIANARPHCVGCGRFMRKTTLCQRGDQEPTGWCAHCNHRMDATWERS